MKLVAFIAPPVEEICMRRPLSEITLWSDISFHIAGLESGYSYIVAYMYKGKFVQWDVIMEVESNVPNGHLRFSKRS